MEDPLSPFTSTHAVNGSGFRALPLQTCDRSADNAALPCSWLWPVVPWPQGDDVDVDAHLLEEERKLERERERQEERAKEKPVDKGSFSKLDVLLDQTMKYSQFVLENMDDISMMVQTHTMKVRTLNDITTLLHGNRLYAWWQWERAVSLAIALSWTIDW